jgi:hypothetical protein
MRSTRFWNIMRGKNINVKVATPQQTRKPIGEGLPNIGPYTVHVLALTLMGGEDVK